MAHPTNDELNLNELQDAAAGIIEPNYSPAVQRPAPNCLQAVGCA